MSDCKWAHKRHTGQKIANDMIVILDWKAFIILIPGEGVDNDLV